MLEKKEVTHKGRIIRTEIRTTATPQQVWEAWTDPVKLSQWFTDRAMGEAKVGTFMTWIFERFGYELPYEVIEALPRQRLILQANRPGREPGILEITIEREGLHTIMRLVNSGFNERAEWDEEYEGVDSGWRAALSILHLYLERYFGRPRSSFLVLHPAEFEYEQVLPFFLEPGGLSKWLTNSGSIGRVGAEYELVRIGS